MVFPFRNPKHLYSKEDYLTTDMLQRRLQYSYITRWITTNGEVEKGVLLKGPHSSAIDGFLVVISDVFHLLPSLPFYNHGRIFQLFREYCTPWKAVPLASPFSSIIGAYCAPLALSYINLTRASSSSSIISTYCAPLVLSHRKQHKPVLPCLSDIV
jgi:hypothetical protein